MPARIEFTEDDIVYIVDAYVDAEWTMADLADEFGVSQNTIRKVLEEEGAEIRSRGRRSS